MLCEALTDVLGLPEGRAMAAVSVAEVDRVEQMLQQTRDARAPVEPSPASAAVSLQDFLHDNGLLSWMDSDEGRCYVLHVCMVRGRATR